MGRPAKKTSKKKVVKTKVIPVVPEPAKGPMPGVPKPEYVLVYLDTDGQLKLEKFKDIRLASNFIAEAKIGRPFYVLLFGEFLVGPDDIESRVPEAFTADIEDDGSGVPVGYDGINDLIPPREDDDENE